MTRVKTIGLAASHAFFGLVGVLLAIRNPGSAPASPQAASSLLKNHSDGSRLMDGSVVPPRSLRPLKDWRGSEYMRAWNAVRHAKLNTVDRIQTQRELLKSWAMVDLAAAMRSALDEAWDKDDGEYYDSTGPLVDVFSDAFAAHPEEAWDLIQNGGFGMGASMLRHVWIQSVGEKNPSLLASLVGALSSSDREKAVDACLSGAWGIDDKETRKLIEQIAAYPDHIVSSEQLARFLMMQGGGIDVSTLREELLHVEKPGDRVAAAKAVVLGKSLLGMTSEQINATVADLPENLKLEVLSSIIDSGISMNGGKLTAILDQMVEANAWDKLAKRNIADMLMMSSRTGDARQVADWVTTIPFRGDTTEIFHRGVETYLRENMEDSRQWIASIPSVDWRDRAYAEYSQQALNANKNPEASRWALDHIQDPAFRSQAEKWRSNWEMRNSATIK